MEEYLETSLKNSNLAKESFVKQSGQKVNIAVDWIVDTFQQEGKLLIFGNGGSAADSQHLAAEFVNRFLLERRPLPALSLSTDSSVLTSIGNDYSFEQVFAKQIEAFAKPQDLAIAISTSGNSANVIAGTRAARRAGIKIIGLTGGKTNPGGKLAGECDLLLNVPTDFTPHIQETHLWIEHILCELSEKKLFSPSS